MKADQWLAERFEEQRGHLRAIAYRMLGSASEADDAVQEAWLRLIRYDASEIENLGAWLTTVVGRVCLDVLRSRKSRREESLEEQVSEPALPKSADNPEHEAVLADSVGLALLVVLDRLTPAERLAFVLHDMFAVPFDEIASIVGRSEDAVRQLASRARRRVQGVEKVDIAKRKQERKVVDAFLAALRAGDFEGLLAVLDPSVVVHLDEVSSGTGAAREIHGATTWAKGAVAFAKLAQFAQPALIDGNMGLVFAPEARVNRVLQLIVEGGKVVRAKVIADPEHLRDLDIAILES